MSDYVRYRIRQTTIDGQAFEPGIEVALKVLATVEPDDIGHDDENVPLRLLSIKDWGGPWAEAHDPGEPPDPIAALVQPRVNYREAVELLGHEAIDREARLLYASYAWCVPNFTPFERLPHPVQAGWTRVAIDNLLRRQDIDKLAAAGDRMAEHVGEIDEHDLLVARDEWQQLRDTVGPKHEPEGGGEHGA